MDNSRDLLFGLGGNDTIKGGGGNDFIYGGFGNDQIEGGADSDIIRGDDGSDILSGGSGNDNIHGDAGQDNIDGGDGDDVLWGGTGILSKKGQYTPAHAGIDDGVLDTLYGGAGRDTIYAGVGDSADGGAGLDHIYGANGAQTLAGGADNDYINGGGGADRLYGGSGSDLFEFTNGAVVEDGASEDGISYAGGKQVTGGTQQWWMEAGWAYHTPVSSLNALGGFVPDFLSAASVAFDLKVGPLFRFALSTTGDLVIQSGRGRIGQMTIKDYDLDLETGEATGHVVAFRSVPVDGKEASLARYKELANLILHAGFGHGLPAGDPLVVDLNGNGLELSRTANSNIYFDFDNDNFAERTAWVKGNDGFLVRDLNANNKIDNGTEMFGNKTTSGLTALKALDSNNDNKITSGDSAFASLKVWQDLDQDGVTDSGELKTLAAVNIKEVSLAPVTPLDTNVRGNPVAAEAIFTRTDNTTGRVGDAVLVSNETDSHYLGNGTISATAAALPGLKGYGTLPDLRISMTNDATLLSQVQSFNNLAITTSWSSLQASADDILFRWAGVQGVAPAAIGSGGFDAQKLAFLEKYFGYELTPRNNGVPSSTNAPQLLDSWNEVLANETMRLAAQGPLKAVMGTTAFTVDQDHFVAANATALATVVGNALSQLSTTASTALTQWNGTWAPLINRYAEAFTRMDKVAVRDDYLLQSLVKAMDGKTLPLTLAQLTDGLALPGDHIGTTGADSLTRGTATGAHQFIGDAGNDTMTGGTGQDVYVFGRNFGKDVIIDSDNAVNGDRIRLAVHNPSDVTIKRVADDLVISVNATTDTITVKDHYKTPVFNITGLPISVNRQIEDIQFADGTIYEAGEIAARVGLGTSGADSITGSAFADEIEGLAGNDTLDGGDDGDTYYYTNGHGQDTIRDAMTKPQVNAPDVLGLLGTIKEEDLRFTRDGKSNDLVITFANSPNDSITLKDQFKYAGTGFDTKFAVNNRIELFMFQQGGTVDWLQIQDKVIKTYTTDGNDITYGFGTSDIFYASAGDDSLVGSDGGDIYQHETGSGYDIIHDQSRYPQTFISGLIGYSWGSDDVLKFGAGVTAADVTFSRDSSAPDLTIRFTNSTDEIVVKDQFDGVKLDLFSLLGVAWFDRIETFQFADGTSLTWEDILKKVTTGTAGNDSLYGAYYNDTLDGGTGNDYLSGGNLDDTYIFGRGYGQDIIQEKRSNVLSTDTDTLRFKSDIAVSDIVFSRDAANTSDLLITIKNTTDTLRIKGHFSTVYTGVFGEQFFNRIEKFVWDSNGTVKDAQSIIQDIVAGYNRPASDNFFGSNGDDRMDGGAGNDTMNGGNGSDTYVFRPGYGRDVIYDKVGNPFGNTPDTLEFHNVAPGDMIISRLATNPRDAVITFRHLTDTIRIQDQFNIKSTGTGFYNIENFVFINDADGSRVTWDNNQILAAVFTQSQTDGNDTITGFPTNDTFTSSLGNDLLIGSSGADIYQFTKGFGKDVIEETPSGSGSDPGDVIQFDASITPANVILTRPNGSNDLVITFTNSSDRITVHDDFRATQGNRWYDIDSIKFSDSPQTVWTDAIIRQKILAQIQTAGNDRIGGFSESETLDGKAGSDTLYGGGGSDTYIGGAGNDRMIDDSYGNTTYVINKTEGHDVISDNYGTDTISFGANITWNDLTFIRTDLDTTTVKITGGSSVELLKGVSSPIETWKFADGSTKTFADVQSRMLAQSATSGKDTIWGYASADTITGGTGNDLMIGREGNDTYVINQGDGHDIIREYNSTSDTISFGAGITWESLLFAKSGTGSIIIKVPGGGTVLIEDGISSSERIENFTFSGNVTKSWADVQAKLTEHSAQAGNDTLNGSTSADTLTGGAGQDWLSGKNGNDTYVINQGDGLDVIDDATSSSSGDAIQFGTGITWSNLSFSRLSGGHAAMYVPGGGMVTIINQFTGSSGSNGIENFRFADGIVKTGQDVRARLLTESSTDNHDVIYGFDKDDTIQGNLGNDTIQAYSGSDTIIYRLGDGHDLVNASGDALADKLILTSISSTGTQFLRNDDNALLIFSDGGSVEIVDMFANSDERFETIQFSNETLTWAQVWQKTLTASFTSGYDVILGYTNYNDTLQGGLGNDSMYSATGADTFIYTLGDGQDTINNYADSADDRIILHSVTATDLKFTRSGDDAIIYLPDSGSIQIIDMFRNTGERIEKLEFSSNNTFLTWRQVWQKTLDAMVTGGDDLIYGYDTDDTVTGGTGDDTIQGYDGRDTIIYNLGDGQDTLYSGSDALADTLQLGTGIHLQNLVFTPEKEDLRISLSDGGSLLLNNQYRSSGEPVENFVIDGVTYSWTEIQTYIKNASTITLLGTPDAETLAGGENLDVIDGLGGNDEINGLGNDDILFGNVGNDTLLGDMGHDTLVGGSGTDTLTGGAGNDQFTFMAVSDSTNSARDVITDFTQGQDLINLAGLGYTDIQLGTGSGTILGYSISGSTTTLRDAAGSLYVTIQGSVNLTANDIVFMTPTKTATTGMDLLLGTSNADTLNALAGNDNISGLEGNDTINGGDGNDVMMGDSGNDKLVGDAGNDTLIGSAGSDDLTGGTGSDSFLFILGDSGIGSANRDTIRDFASGADKLHLSGMALDIKVIGSSAFTASTTVPELRVYASGGNTLAVLDSNGDNIADAEFLFIGNVSIAQGDLA